MRATTVRLHNDIRKEFEQLSNIKEFGVQKYSTVYILNKISEKFYKSPKTIENIVFNRVAQPKQTAINLFTLTEV